MPELDSGAMHLAAFAFMETPGPNDLKVKAAIWAYLWALENTRPIFTDMTAYPSLNDLRAALVEREKVLHG